ncbi:MAG: hypothetical protein ACMXYG_04650 [Candidatus Woesearchaeota archaeon]
MKRKIIKLGESTLVASLPSKWIKKNELNPGNEIDIDEKDNQLILSSSNIKKERKEVNIIINSNNKEEIHNILTHSYRKGFEIIKFTNIDKYICNKIKNITKELLLGFELTKKEKNYCVVENITEPADEKHEIILRRAFLITKETFNQILEKQNISEIEGLKQQHDRYILFCRRSLTKKKSENLHLYWELLTFLMHIQHSLYYMYKYITNNKIKIDKNIEKAIKELNNYFELYYKSFFNKDLNLIYQINKIKYELHFGKFQKSIEQKKGKNAVVYSYLKETARLIQIGTSPIISIIIN